MPAWPSSIWQTVSMTETTKPTPVIVRARALLAEAETLVERPPLSGGAVEAWVLKTRNLLSNAFGDDSPHIAACLPPGRDPPERSQQDRIRLRMPVVASIVKAMGRVQSSRKLFLGHGHSLEWLRLKDFLGNTLKLDVAEFNVEPQAGIHTTERLDATP